MAASQRPLLVFLSVALTVGVGLQAQDAGLQPAQQAASRASQQGGGVSALAEKAGELGKQLSQRLVVNGQALDPLEIQRQTVYLVGQRQLRQKLIELLIDDQIEEAIKRGRKRAEFDVLEKEVETSIQKAIKDFEDKNPGKKFWGELAKTNTTQAEYRTMQRGTLLFDKIFFHGIPKNWPEITKECIIAAGGEQGRQFFKRFEESVKEGQEVPALWIHICRQWVMQKLQDWSDVRYASDGLAPDVTLEVNGRQWKTVDAVKAMALKITPTDQARALTDIALQTSLRQEFEKKGFWMNDEQYKKEFAEYRKPFDETPFNVKVMALSFKGYPSFEVYKARWRLERCFEHMVKQEINDENLGKYLERAKSFLADGRISLKLIRIPAFNDATGTWHENGWQEAKKKADMVFEQIASGKLSFDLAMKKYSSWPEQVKSQGQLVSKSMNELRQELRESEYTDFVAGYSVGEIFFYDVKEGHVAGPLRGQDGYYIGVVTSRQAPTSTMDLKDKNQRDLVKQDYLSHRFLAWANEIAAKTQVK